jgi:hypothetical protein
MRKLTLVFVFGFAELFLSTFFGLRARSSEVNDLCFFKTESGQILNLDPLCRNQRKPMRKVTTELDPNYVERTPDGGYWVSPGADVSFQLPTGHIIDPDGTITEPDGTKYQPVMKDGQFLGMQYFRADGSPAQPGEILTLPNKQTIQQPRF